jgi:hypothetical protein
MNEAGTAPPVSWVGAPDLDLVVRCGGADHTLKVVGTEFQLLAHPNLDAELALVAFGGDEPRCVSLYHLWTDAVTDGGFLGEWVDETRMNPAWFSWLAMALDRMRAEGFHEFLRQLPPARAQRMGEFLHHMPRPWIDRAAATVSEAVFEADGVACTFAPSALSTATGNRLRRAFVDAVGGRQLAVGAAALVPLRMSTTKETGEPGGAVRADGVLRGVDRGIALTVGNTWLHRVWAVGAAVIEDQLVLALDESTGTAAMVGWEPVAEGGHRPFVETCAVHFVDGGWVRA